MLNFLKTISAKRPTSSDKLFRLKEKGAITEQEYNARKARLLA